MGERFKPNNRKLTARAWRVIGAAEVLQALEDVKGPAAAAPGFQLAKALAEKVVADGRAILAGDALRAAAKAGHDIGRSKHVSTTFDGDDVVIEVEPYDLADAGD